MGVQVVVEPAAEEDLRIAYDYYETMVSGLGARFLAEVERTLSQVAERPDMYQEIIPEVRRALLRVFPYGVFYVQSSAKAHVIAVVSDVRDPMYWRSRIGT